MEKLKRCLITQGVDTFQINENYNKTYVPKAGDLAVFEVKKVGKHSKMQIVGGRLRHIFPGDQILATFGNRYATGQFEGYVPGKQVEEYHILGQGGAVGILHSTHDKWAKVGPTTLRLLGYAVDRKGSIINTKYYSQEEIKFNPNKVYPFQTILSVGSSMDSGKTTTAGFLARGLRKAGKRVAYIKLTGTVYTKDKEFVEDCGAYKVLDFSDYGFPSTYMCSLEELLNLYTSLLHSIVPSQPDYIVIEVADGLLQRETNMLLFYPGFMNTIDHVILSCGDSMGVPFGLELLTGIGHRPFALSGLFTASPLLRMEVEQCCQVPVLSLSDMQEVERLETVLRTSVSSMAS